MSAACLAVLRERFAQVFPCSMQPHGQIVPSEPQFGGHLFGLSAFQIDLLEKLTILLRHERQKALKALAKDSFVPWSRRIRKFSFESIESAFPRALAAVEIDDRTSENPVEPGGGCLVAGRLTLGGQRFDETLLNDVLSQVRVAQSLARKRHKSL